MPVYPNAPITEAVFDIRIKKLDGSRIESLKNIPDSLRAKYPKVQNRPEIKISFAVKEGSLKPAPFPKPSEVGYIYSNQLGTRLFQFRLDGYTFNILKPYSNWEEFSKEAFRIWELYKKQLDGEVVIERIGLRYINRINIPVPFSSFEDYLTYIPPIPDTLPKILNRFFMQVEIPVDETNIKVVLTETIEPIGDKNLPFILDIDCVRIWSSDDMESQLGNCFALMRETKNNIFESCITDKARELFK